MSYKRTKLTTHSINEKNKKKERERETKIKNAPNMQEKLYMQEFKTNKYNYNGNFTRASGRKELHAHEKCQHNYTKQGCYNITNRQCDESKLHTFFAPFTCIQIEE